MQSKNDPGALAENLFSKFPSRFRRKEKDAFLDYCKQEFAALGYGEEEIMLQKKGGGTNLIAGPPGADILVTAHYDTPASNGLMLAAAPLVGQTLCNLVIIITGALAVAASYVTQVFTGSFIIYSLIYAALFILLGVSFLVKNKENRNDNTSGVIGVFTIAALAADNPGLRKKCAFVLFDNEEWGLMGSLAFSKWRGKEYPDKKDAAVINLDCIGNGDILLLAAKNGHEVLDAAADFLQAEGFSVEKKKSSMIFLSDHAHFSKGIMISFVKKSKLGYLYLPKIHTGKDIICDLENLGRLASAVYMHICETAGTPDTDNIDININKEMAGVK
jgi:hypothetical protein